MNTKIALSFVSIVASLALVGGATFALFTDSASSQDNTFATGNASLLIADDVPPADPGTYAESILGVSFTNIAPNFSEDKDFWLKNDSGGTFGMDTTVDLTDVGGSGAGAQLQNVLMIGFRCDTNENGLGDGDDTVISAKSITSWINDDPVSLATIGASTGPSDATNASDQDEMFCRMTASIDSSVGDEIAGQTISFDGMFDAEQTTP